MYELQKAVEGTLEVLMNLWDKGALNTKELEQIDRLRNAYERELYDTIAMVWSVDDFDDIAPWMTLEERRACLSRIEHNMDCNLGITWETLYFYARDYPKPNDWKDEDERDAT